MHCIKQRDEFFLKLPSQFALMNSPSTAILQESVQINGTLREWWMGKRIFKQLIIVLAACSWDLPS